MITSAGGCEASWQWQSSGSNTAGGTSYFSALLMNGLGGYHAADINKDNTVTINEAYAFLLENCASSTPHRYPEDAQDAPLFLYHPEDSHALPPVSALTFEDTLLSSDQTDVDFSFTVHRDTRLFYQLVYYKDGKWDDGELTSNHNITLNECACVFQYAQTCFEGLKAYTTVDGRTVTFRPDMNAQRMFDTAKRLEMPTFPKERFVDAVKQVIKANFDCFLLVFIS